MRARASRAIQASVDTFGAFGASVDYNVVTGDGAAFRVNAMYENLQNHRDFYDGERFGINPNFGFDIGNSTRLDVSYEYIDHERFIDRGIPTGANGEPVEAFTDIVFRRSIRLTRMPSKRILCGRIYSTNSQTI